VPSASGATATPPACASSLERMRLRSNPLANPAESARGTR
jgi:hypothetical protein